MKSPLAGVGSTQVIHGSLKMFNGLKQECFNPVMLSILDRFFMNGYYEFMSREQEGFLREFIRAAGKVTDGMLRNESLPRMKLSHEFLQFDRFLGGYRG